MNNSQIISIIVPVYNIEQYIDHNIQSVLNQDNPNWELILVNDGSTDKSALICDRFASLDRRIKVVHKPNGGLVSARNAGFDIAQGDWIMYLDGDDWISQNTVNELQIYINKYPNLDVIFWNLVQELKNVSIKNKWVWDSSLPEKLYTDNECRNLSYNTLIYKKGIASPCTKLINRKFATQYNLLHNKSLRQGIEGLDYSLRVFYFSKRALYVHKYFTHYRYNEESISKKSSEINSAHLLDCFNEINKFISEQHLGIEFKNALNQRILYSIIAMSMSTYFHPDFEDKLNASRKFNAIIENNTIIKDSLNNKTISELDKQRKVIAYIIKWKLYFILPFIAKLKLYYIAKGKFSY